MKQIYNDWKKIKESEGGGFEPTEEQLEAINSGIDSEWVDDIEVDIDNAKNDITNLDNDLTGVSQDIGLLNREKLSKVTTSGQSIYAHNGNTQTQIIFNPDEPFGSSQEVISSDEVVINYIDEKKAEVLAEVETKQDELVSGVNIKTINEQSIIGEGNLRVTASPDMRTEIWSGSVAGGVVNFRDNYSINDFKRLVVKGHRESWDFIWYIDVADLTNNVTLPFILPLGWGGGNDGFLIITAYTNTSITFNVGGTTRVLRIIGIS